MFFHKCSYKNSYFSELAYNSSVLVLIQKRCCYLKNVALDFVLLVLKLYPIQVVISLPLWIKLTMDQLLLFFLCNFFSYVGGILVANHSSLLLIDRYILDIKQIITHKEHSRNIFRTASEALAQWS